MKSAGSFHLQVLAPAPGAAVWINGQPVARTQLSLLEVWAGETDDLSPWLEATKAKQADYYLARMKTPRMINGPGVSALAADGSESLVTFAGP